MIKRNSKNNGDNNLIMDRVYMSSHVDYNVACTNSHLSFVSSCTIFISISTYLLIPLRFPTLLFHPLNT
jgi:hypothetical protein